MGNATTEVHTIEEFKEFVRSNQNVLVDYFADWCGPCRALAPVIDRAAKAAGGQFQVVKVDIDSAPELAERANVGEIPALHFYRDGRKVAVLTGFRTDDALKNQLIRYGLVDEAGPAPDEHRANSLAGRVLARLLGDRQSREADSFPSTTEFTFIQSEQELAEVIARSFSEKTPIFLHDPSCPISARAFRQMSALGGVLPTIDVSRQRALTRELSQRTGVRHQSPQVLVLRDAASTWNASHSKITTKSVRAAIGEAATREPGEK